MALITLHPIDTHKISSEKPFLPLYEHFRTEVALLAETLSNEIEQTFYVFSTIYCSYLKRFERGP